MRTPSHLIVTAVLAKELRKKTPVAIGAALWGSVAPDIPLFVLSIGTGLYHLGSGASIETIAQRLFGELFYESPVWIIAYNLPHAPLLLLAALTLMWRFRSLVGTRGHPAFWFVAAATLHVAIDIPLHADDGPLLLFPFEWSIRFESPVSYWDPEHHGDTFRLVEVGLDVLLLAYLATPSLQRLLRARRG